MWLAFKNNSFLTNLCLVLFFLLPLQLVHAQEIPAGISPAVLLPSSANPAFVGQSLPQVPARPRGAAVSPPAEQTSPLANQTEVTLKLRKLTVIGATVYSNEELEQMFNGYIGKTVSVADLQKMADEITTKYKKAGYILSKAVLPAQTIKNGEVTIQVIEGYIKNVTVEGKPRRARSLLNQYMSHIQEEQPSTIDTMQRYILLSNDVPGVTAKAVIQPTPDQKTPSGKIIPAPVGAADLALVTQTDIINAYAAYDNRGTLYMGPQEYSLGSNVNSLVIPGDQLGFQSLASVDFKESKYIRPFYQVPIGSNGGTLNLSSSFTKTQPGFILEPLDVIGNYETYAGVYTYPIIRTRNNSLYFNFDFDTSANISSLFDNEILLYDDQLRSLRAGLTYDWDDRAKGVNEIAVQFSQGLSLLGASPIGGTTLSRPDGRSNYNKLTLNAFRIQGLPHNFSALLGVKGQYAFLPLLTAEEFTLGGTQYGRAYDPAEIVGDSGAAGKIELRYDFPPILKFINAFQPFIYYDVGATININTTGGQAAQNSLSSAGIGFRAQIFKYFSGSLEIDKPLTLEVATEGNKDPRGFFSIVGSF